MGADKSLTENTRPRPIRLLRFGYALIALWLGITLFSGCLDICHNRDQTRHSALLASRTAYQKDITYRQWNAEHQSVYVPIDENTPPNPYLPQEDREIRTASGLVLTRVNPAYMNRQTHGIEKKNLGVISRITSLEPIRPENTPDAWETEALEKLAAGEKEVSAVVSQDGRDYMRLMRPLVAEEACLSCHAGNQVGDLRGGLSVAVPMAPFQAMESGKKKNILLRHGLFALLGLSGIGIGLGSLRRAVAENRRHQEALHRSEERFRSIFKHAGAGMTTVTREGEFLEVNAALCNFLGYREDELKKLSIPMVTHPDDLARTESFFREVQAGTRANFHYEKRFVRKDGQTVWGAVSTTWLRRGPEEIYGIGLIHDITERVQAGALAKENAARLHYQAHHDALTDLPNRLLLMGRLEHALAVAKRAGKKVAVLFFDLDRFKTINDSMGHEKGDRLLCEVALRLRNFIRESDMVARFGGDEFIVALEQIDDIDQVIPVARKILTSLSLPIHLEGHKIYPSVSIGISLYPEDGKDVETLIKSADVAMYSAKEKGRNRYEFYRPDMNARTRELLLLESELRQALEQNELTLFYQPQIELSSGKVTGVEALVRWRHPLRGLVPPGDFIPLAEESGLILPIGDWVLQSACLQHRRWLERGYPLVRMAVNISARQFREDDLPQKVAHALRVSGLDPQHLELELTESMVMHDVEAAIGTMEEIRRLGVHLSIDDFGSGYSSLSYLKRFPINRLKIDRSFLDDLPANPKNAAMVRSIISLAESMKLQIVAEGVETEEQKTFLFAQGCAEAQGFLFSYPLSGEQVEAMLEQVTGTIHENATHTRASSPPGKRRRRC